MTWLKTYWKDSTFRKLTYALIAGGPIVNIVIKLSDATAPFPDYWAFVWGFYLIIVLPLCYLMRNNP
jgi:hypothetical protein